MADPHCAVPAPLRGAAAVSGEGLAAPGIVASREGGNVKRALGALGFNWGLHAGEHQAGQGGREKRPTESKNEGV